MQRSLISLTFPRSLVLACLALACSLVVVRGSESCPSGSGHSVDDARALFLKWLGSSSIPGKYSSAADRLRDSEHQGDLNNNVIFSEGKCGPRDYACHGGQAQWPHTKPNPLYTRENDEWESNREDMVAASAWLLWRGMSRLQDAVFQMLTEVSPNEIDDLMLLARRALNSFEDFWRQLSWTVAYGERQVEWHVAEEMKEYGPDTNFWLKFRPTLACSHSPRLGPELGGAKTWCNEAFHSPKTVLSLGSGDDFMYEHLVVEKWPGATIVTADCFQFDKPTMRSFEEGKGRNLILPVCLTGESREYADLYPPQFAEKFVTFPWLVEEVAAKHEIEQFDLVKCNIEASEYGMFAHALQDPDKSLRGTAQINMETHRMGMHDQTAQKGYSGRDFNSLLFMELLFAHLLSGGFHPVYTEKWHDTNAAQDVVFVNQTWWLWSELQHKRTLWTQPFPHPPLMPSASPDGAKELAEGHAAGSDPFVAPGGAVTKREQRAGKGKGEQEPKKKKKDKSKDKGQESNKKKKKKGKKEEREPESEELEEDQYDAYASGGGAGAGAGGWGASSPPGVVRQLDGYALAAMLDDEDGDAVPSFVMLELGAPGERDCEQCATMRQFWDMVGQNFANVWAVKCNDAANSMVCDTILSNKPPDSNPLFVTWTGEQFDRYQGPKSPDALVQSLRAAVQAGGSTRVVKAGAKKKKKKQKRVMTREEEMEAMFAMADGPEEGTEVRKGGGKEGGGWEDMPVVSSDISVAEFVRRFVEPGIPVVMRARGGARAVHGVSRSGTEWLKWLGKNCGEGMVHRFSPQAEGNGWAGFGESEMVPMKTLTKQLLKIQKAKDAQAGTDVAAGKQDFVYGFDFRTRCDCAPLLDEVRIPPHFLADRLGTDPALPRTNWPALLVGPPGSTSAMHVDSKFLPFWLSLFSGRKTFRVVTLEDWREHLAGPGNLFSHEGTVQQRVDAFDDEAAAREYIGRGATVYNITLLPGDTIYLPVGALHGALNREGGGPAVALTANFLDADHGPQVGADYCDELPGAVHSDALCALLARDPALRSAQVRLPPRPAQPQPFWAWHLSDAVRPGFCAKYAAPDARCPGAAERCAKAAEGDGMLGAFKSAFAEKHWKLEV